MGTGYTRNDTLNNIADGNIINASDLDGEFDAVESAFNESTGHTHDGTAAEGAPITVLGPVQDFIASATEIKPKTTNTLDIGTVSLQFKDMHLDGTAYLDDIQAVGAVDITGDLDVDNINIDGNTIISTDTNGAINITPNGTGAVNITATTNITGDLDVDNININGNTIISTDTNGDINISPDGTGTVVIDTDLDVDNININGNTIISTDTNGDINISPDGTGTVVIDTDLDVDNININGNTISSTDTNGNINLVPNGTGVVALSSTDLTFGDNDKAIFGAGSDLEIYSDGANAVIDHTNTGAGALYLKGDNNVIITNQAGTENKAVFASNGAVTLYYDNAAKLATTNTGVDVTGTLTSDGLTVDGNTNGDPTLAHFYNINTGTAAETTAYITNSATKADGLFLQQLGSGFTTAGGFVQDGSAIGSGTGASGGLSIMTRAAAAMRFYTNGHTNERMRIDSSGNVGIGTTSPTNGKLEVTNANSTVPTGFFRNTSGSGNSPSLTVQGGANNAAANFSVLDYNGNTDFVVQGAGFVGIGTSSPSTSLDVEGSGVPVSINSDNSNTYKLEWEDAGVTRGYLGASSSASLVVADSSASERMRITSDGDVGIGRTDPQNIVGSHGGGLVVQSAAGRAATTTAIAFQDSSGNNQFQQLHNGETIFSTGSTERMRIDSSGNVGIGISPTSPLHVSSSTAGNVSNIVSSNASYGNDVVQIRCARSGATTQYNNLSVFDNNTSLKMLIRANGDLLNANNSYGSLSDETLKENIIDSASQWDDIKAIQVRKYNFIDSDETQIGVIAQELEAAGMSGLVDTVEMYSANEEDEPERNGEFKKSVKYSVLYMKALKALQEAMTRIEMLEENQVALETRLAALEAN